uniref:Solute carrier family 66 member 2 n=1 Tax=Macrostomum lignano TaxID=282301 RepID=A0A1I8I8M1_9PLAT
MVFGGVVPYVPQYLQIKRTGNTEGFSQYVCLTLLLANILRILFWFCKHFELPLLAQSFVMIFTMLCMVHIYVRTRQKTILPTDKIRRFIDLESAHFWKWTDFLSYLQFLLLFTVAASCITYPLSDQPVFVELLGFLAVFFEALLGAPQFYRNLKNRSTDGMSIAMVAMWTSGDIFKTSYFIVRSAPVQFWLCGLLQVGIDLAIFGQVYLYSAKPPP